METSPIEGNMDIEQALLEQIRSLSPQAQQEVLNFAAFLRQKTPLATRTDKTRVPGLHQGSPYWMADDCDAPLPDEFWLGEA
jgi:hypothetical protein